MFSKNPYTEEQLAELLPKLLAIVIKKKYTQTFRDMIMQDEQTIQKALTDMKIRSALMQACYIAGILADAHAVKEDATITTKEETKS